MAKRTLQDLKKDLIQLRKKLEGFHDSTLLFQCGHCGTFFWKEELWDKAEFDELFYESFQRPAGLRGLTKWCRSDECQEQFLIEPLNAHEHLGWLESQV
jgi:hypothetical protein